MEPDLSPARQPGPSRDGEIAGSLTLEDLFDLGDLQKIQDAFAEATCVASIIMDIRGRAITRPSRFSRLCTEIIRQTELGGDLCRINAAMRGGRIGREPCRQHCFSSGLMEGSATILAGGLHVATWVIGQVLEEGFDPTPILDYGKAIGADPLAFATALDEVPRMPRAQFENVTRAMHVIADQLSLLAVRNRQHANDLKDRTQAADALRKRNRDKAALLQAIPDMLYILGWDGQVLIARADEAENDGASPDPVLGRPIEEVLPAAVLVPLKAAMEEVRVGGGLGAFEYVLDPDGLDPRSFEARVVPVDGDRAMIIARDITDRKKVEETLREGERSLREAQEAGHVGTYIWDLRRDAWKSSPVLDQIFGIGSDHPKNLAGWIGLAAPEFQDRLLAYFHQTVACNSRFDLEYPILRVGDGQTRWLHGKGLVERDPGGNPIRMVGTVLDVTERREAEVLRRKLENEIQHALRVESIGFLAGGVAHDMNNVLAALRAMTETLGLQRAADGDLKSALEVIQKATDRGRDLVRGLTNFARKDLRDPVALDLNHLVKEEVDILTRTSLMKLNVVAELAEDLPMIMGDKGALSGALMNFCVNAMDAMSEGGTLTLRTRKWADTEIVLEVQDTGRGMSTEVLSHALDPFFTTKGIGKGTGLGLPLALATARAHGGDLAIQSEEGIGTTVQLRLPVPLKGEPVAAEAQAAGPRNRMVRILLVDDDELILASVPPLLRAFGHRVATAEGGQAALDLLRTNDHFDMVMLDLNMPTLNGVETLKLLRQIRPELPVLMATGFLDPQTEVHLGLDPRALTIGKPFSMGELNQKIQQLMLGFGR